MKDKNVEDIYALARADRFMIQDLARELAMLVDDVHFDKLTNVPYREKALKSACDVMDRYFKLLEEGKKLCAIADLEDIEVALLAQIALCPTAIEGVPAKTAKYLEELGLLKRNRERWFITNEGRRYLDTLKD